jgi:hypothetical protein
MVVYLWCAGMWLTGNHIQPFLEMYVELRVGVYMLTAHKPLIHELRTCAAQATLHAVLSRFQKVW